MARAGIRPAIIARELTININTLYGILRQSRLRGDAFPACGMGPLPYDGPAVQMRVRIPPSVADALKGAADARDITRAELCRQLLEAIVEDRLIDPIIDDGVRSDG